MAEYRATPEAHERRLKAAKAWRKERAEELSLKARQRRASMSAEEKAHYAEHRRQLRIANRQAKIEEYLEREEIPKCKCGCGQDVNFDAHGKINSYTLGHNGLSLEQKRAATVEYLSKVDRIDIDKLRVALRNYKDSSGLTWREVAEKAGIGYQQLQDILYNDKMNTSVGMERELVENMLRRLLGHAAPPSRHMLAEQAKMRRRRVEMPDGEVYRPMVAAGYDPAKRAEKFQTNGT